MIVAHPFFLYFFIGLFFLCIGSLLNVIIYRLPIMMKNEWQEQCCELLQIEGKGSGTPINLFFPRSFCPNCKTQVKAWHNIPVLSYLFLRGRCSYCHHKISFQYPLVELLTLIFSLYATWHFGFTLALPFVLIALWLFISLVFIDLEHQLLPDTLTLSLLWLGLMANTQQLFTSLPNAVFSAVGAYLSLWLFIKLYYLMTGKIGMGHGDFKLFAALGAWFGWTLLPLILLISSLSGAIAGLAYLHFTKQSKETGIPFGPFLCFAGVIALFWGKSLVKLYFK